MNKLIKYIAPLAILLVALTGCSENNTPKEGEKYTVVPTPTENIANVVELFSLGCGHCRNMEAMLPEIEKKAGVDVHQVHVTFNESAQLAAYIYNTAAIQMDGKPSLPLVEALFGYVQDESAQLSEEERQAKLNAIFDQYNLVSPFDLDEAQRQLVYQQLTDANQIEVNAKITSVPSFLVQGKYLVQSSAHESLDDLANTIKYLSTKQ